MEKNFNEKQDLHTCFCCGKNVPILATPMRCRDCFEKKIEIGTSPVGNAYWAIETDKNPDNEK